MINSYQNSIIAQLLEAITGQINFTGAPTSNIGDILLSILEQTPYDKEPKSVLAELFLKLKDKLEGRAFTSYDKEPKSAIAEILLSILNETEYDKEPNSHIAELLLELKAELESYVELTASGAIANFTTSVVKPLVNLTAYFKATQEAGTPTPQSPKTISGVSAVNNIHCGANLWDEQWELGYISNTTGENSPTTTQYRTVGYIKIPQGVNLYLFNGNSDTLGLRYYDKNKNFIGSRANLSSKALVYGTNDLPTETAYIRFINTSTNAYLNNISINYPSSDTEYHAYNPNSSTTLINLGGTYYGGYVSQDKNGKRELVVTCAKEHISLQGRTPTTASGYDRYSIPISSETTGGGLSADKKCSVLESYAYSDTRTSEHFYIYSTSLIVFFTENTFRNGEFDVVYPLETPFTVALPDGEPITAFNGVNNIYNDSGDTSVTYLAKIEDNLNATAKFRAEEKAQKEKAKEEEKEIIKEDPIEEVKQPIKDSGETKKGAN